MKFFRQLFKPKYATGEEIELLNQNKARVIPIDGRITHAKVDDLLAGTKEIYRKRTVRKPQEHDPIEPPEAKSATNGLKGEGSPPPKSEGGYNGL